MRKKYLSALLFGALVMASTVTFTSCIDNDEPAGIENLRGAKAELLRAKVAVEQADAAYKLAQAESEKADAALTLAKAEIKKQLAEKQKLENELQAAKNEKEKAVLQAAIEETNAKLEQNKLRWQATLLDLKTSLAQAEKKYEDAMKALELSKGMISDAEASQLAWAQDKLNAAKGKLTDAHDDLAIAYTAYYDAVAKPENYFSEAAIESLIADKKLVATEAKNELSLKLEALNALKSGDAYTAWENLKASYQAKLDSLDQVIADKTNKQNAIIAEFQNAEIKDLQTAVVKIATYINDGDYTVSEKDSTFTVSAAIKGIIDAATAAQGTNFIVYDNASGKYTAKFKSIKVMNLYQNNDPDDRDITNSAAAYATLLDNTYAFDATDNSGYTKAVKEIEAVVKALGELKGNINPNQPAYAEETVKEAKKAMDDAKTLADAAIKTWKDAVDSYNSTSAVYSAVDFAADKASIAAQLNMYNTSSSLTADETAQNTAIYNAYKAFVTKLTSNGQTAPVADASSEALFKTNLNTIKTQVSALTYRAVDKAAVLLAAAQAAFGDAGVYNDGTTNKGVLVQPTDEAVAAATNGGAQGAYLAKKATYDAAVAAQNMAGKYDEAIAQLNAWKAALATQKAEYMASEKVTKLIKAVTDAQAAVTEKVATPIKELGLKADSDMKLLIEGIKNSFVDSTTGEIKEFARIISALESEIGEPADPTTNTPASSGSLYEKIDNAEEAVLRAEKLLEVYKSGNWSNQDAITWAEEELQRKKDAYNAAVAEFNYWNGKVAALLNTLYGSAAE